MQYTGFSSFMLSFDVNQIEKRNKRQMDFERMTKNKPLKVKRHKLDFDEIENKKIGFVYFLFKDDVIVYVGQSRNHPIARVIQHCKDKVFDEYSYIPVPKKKMTYYEAKYIYEYEPKYNQVFPSRGCNFDVIEVETDFLGKDELRKEIMKYCKKHQCDYLLRQKNLPEHLSVFNVECKIIGKSLAIKKETLNNITCEINQYINKLIKKPIIEKKQREQAQQIIDQREEITRKLIAAQAMNICKVKTMVFDCNNRA